MEIALQDGSAGRRLDWLEPYVLAAAVPEHDLSSGGLDVANPVRVRAEHGNEVSLTLVIGHHDWE
jgi:hypothetical protein